MRTIARKARINRYRTSLNIHPFAKCYCFFCRCSREQFYTVVLTLQPQQNCQLFRKARKIEKIEKIERMQQQIQDMERPRYVKVCAWCSLINNWRILANLNYIWCPYCLTEEICRRCDSSAKKLCIFIHCWHTNRLHKKMMLKTLTKLESITIL